MKSECVHSASFIPFCFQYWDNGLQGKLTLVANLPQTIFSVSFSLNNGVDEMCGQQRTLLFAIVHFMSLIGVISVKLERVAL